MNDAAGAGCCGCLALIILIMATIGLLALGGFLLTVGITPHWWPF